ncbi:hypothetical protein SH139x_003785 [Planctomycetaceae bacterium SH139]
MIRHLPLIGVTAAFALLAISAFGYSGDVHWTRVTVSMLCAPELVDGETNPGRGLAILGLLLLCLSMSLLFELISRLADTRRSRGMIQISGIGAMVYAFLTATPMHNLMVSISLSFFVVALVSIINMLHFKQRNLLALAGIIFLGFKLASASLYYLNSFSEIWGTLQKLTFLLTTAWLFAVHLIVGKGRGKGQPNDLSGSDLAAVSSSTSSASGGS